MNSSNPPPTASNPPMAATQTASPLPPAARTEGISVLQGSLPRLLGYGLLGLFALDIAQVLAVYFTSKPGEPSADLNLAGQFIERIGVAIVAYALIFGVNTVAANRHERTLLKLLSWASLVGLVLYLGLTGLVAMSAVRLHARAVATITFQENSSLKALQAGQGKIDTMSVAQLALVHRQISPNDRIEPIEANREQLLAAVKRELPETIQNVRSKADSARFNLRKDELMSVVKYGLGGLISAGICLAVWENTRGARRHRIFRPKDAPSMQLEDRAADTLRKVQNSVEDAFALHTLERFRWYRRLRRFFAGKHGHH